MKIPEEIKVNLSGVHEEDIEKLYEEMLDELKAGNDILYSRIGHMMRIWAFRNLEAALKVMLYLESNYYCWNDYNK